MSPPKQPPPIEIPPPPESDGEDVVGLRLGKYEVLKRLATGGMAEILLARAQGLPGFQTVVVIKRILPQLATKKDFVEMFLAEARIAATLQHPNIVQTYDVGLAGGSYFMAMEYLHGEDVRSMQKALAKQGGKMPLAQALQIIISVADALEYAHEKVGFDGQPLNIVHRDVSPQNVLLTYEGGVKLLDFGIARTAIRRETHYGTLKGKLSYMSPEQCRGESLDRRADLFALGILLYELTLGVRLFRGGGDFNVLKKIVEEPIAPPHELDPSYPPALERIVLRALEKDRDLRYPTARELQADLEAMAHEAHFRLGQGSLQAYVETIFGKKIEAWREAMARGQTFTQHLRAVSVVEEDEDEVELEIISEKPSEDGDLPPLPVEDPVDPKAIELASLFHSLGEAVPQAVVDGEHQRLASARSPLLGASPGAAWSRGRSAMLGAAALVLAAVGGLTMWKTRAKTASPSVMAPVSVAAAPVASPPPAPPAPIVVPIAVPIAAAPAPRPVTPVEMKPVEVVKPAAMPGPEAVVPSPIEEPRRASPARPPHHLQPSDRVHHGPAGVSKTPTAGPALPAPPPVAVEPARLEGDGTLVVATTPWCNVNVDGEAKGQTPLSLKLPAGQHVVVLENPEFNIRRSLPVVIKPNETTKKKLDFAP